jgi:hypothetical protein
MFSIKMKPGAVEVAAGAGAPNPPKPAVEAAGAPNPPKAAIIIESRMRKEIIETVSKICLFFRTK